MHVDTKNCGEVKTARPTTARLTIARSQ